MKRRFRLPVSPILLALPILTSFDAFETPFAAVALGKIAAQEPPSAAEEEEIDFELDAPGEFALAPNDAPQAPTPENDAAANADRPTTPFAPADALDSDAPNVLATETVDDAEMKRLSQDPLFQEFSAAFDEAAPLPTLPNLDAFGAAQDADALLQNGDARPTPSLLISPVSPNLTPNAAGKLASSTAALDEILTIAAVDLDSLPLSETERAILTRLDAEIARLCPLWLDAELNRNVVGRRERVWERAETPFSPNPANPSEAPNLPQTPVFTNPANPSEAPNLPHTPVSSDSAVPPEALNVPQTPVSPDRPFFARPDVAQRSNAPTSGVRFEVADPKPVASASDWALAPAAPFFFEVVDSATGDVFYTKAGDFEPFEGGAALVRGDRIFVATIEPGPGTPSSGNAERTRILPNGQIQGVDATGKRVVAPNLGTFSLYLFDNPARLASVDGVFFVPTAESGAPRPAKLPANAEIGVESGRLLLSNGRPDEIFARIVVLCKSKKRLVEILTQPRLAPETPTTP